MFTFSSESSLRLLGCGVDAERIGRFVGLSVRDAWPLVFTPNELSHIRFLPDQAEGFCASFCFKEAFFKAIGEPYNFTECELLLEPEALIQPHTISVELCGQYGIRDSEVRILRPASGELLALVHLFGEQAP